MGKKQRGNVNLCRYINAALNICSRTGIACHDDPESCFLYDKSQRSQDDKVESCEEFVDRAEAELNSLGIKCTRFDMPEEQVNKVEKAPDWF